MAPIDPHSYTDSTHPLTTHISLSFYFDFFSSIIYSAAHLSLSAPHSGPLNLDTRSLSIYAVKDPVTGASLPFTLDPSPDTVLGQSLVVTLSNQSQLLVLSKTAPSSSALQWLPPAQTFNKSHPFVLTLCQAIHARSIFPCQDTPAARITFAAKLNIPRVLKAVMAAKHVKRRDPAAGECGGVCDDALWCAEERVVEEFVMEQPIPPSLFSFAVGDLGFKEVSPRTKVYSEVSVLEYAAKEFAGLETMIKAGEKLFGPYKWERFDLLVLPPSFAFGGMGNPRMATVIKGDAKRAQVVAHKLAHSWTGHLITNKTNDHFWLSEGFTTYAERRIVEAVQGRERAMLNIRIGYRGLIEQMERFKDRMEFTKLKTNQQGVDPDEVYSEVPYEKGFQFLWCIERQIGRPAFDDFLKKYIATFEFQSIDTDMFLDFLKANVPEIKNQVDLIEWTEGTGIPPDAMEPDSEIYTEIVSLANEFKSGRMPKENEVAHWGGMEWELYLQNLPKSVEASLLAALDNSYGLAESENYEVKVAYLRHAISSRCRSYDDKVKKTLNEVGRIKYLRPLYTALVQDRIKLNERRLALQVFSEARHCYHPIAMGVVEAIFAKHNVALCIKSSPAIVRNFKKRSAEVADDSRKKQHVCYKEQDTWKTLTDDAGWVYYLNTKNEHWQWNAPGSLPLPSPWLKYTHRDGRTYYWNDSTKKMQLLEQYTSLNYPMEVALLWGQKGWSIHGGWPVKEDSLLDLPYDPDLITGTLKQDLINLWPNELSPDNCHRFWKEEWDRHGRYSGLDQVTYFQTIVDAVKGFDLPSKFKLKVNKKYSVDDAITIIHKKVGYDVTMLADPDPDLSGQVGYVHDIKLLMRTDFLWANNTPKIIPKNIQFVEFSHPPHNRRRRWS